MSSFGKERGLTMALKNLEKKWYEAFRRALVCSVVKYFEGYFKFISCLYLMFYSWLESCYDQFIDQG